MNTNSPNNIADSSFLLTSQARRLTRSGVRRQGDEYQDVQALDFLIDWLEHTDRYQWVHLETDGSGFLDDINIMRVDNVLEAWQVKYSTTSHKPEDIWTWNMLLEQKSGITGLKSSLLQKWFKTWQSFVSKEIKVSLGMISNRHGAMELSLDNPRDGKVRWRELSKDIRESILAQLDDETQVQEFFEVFRFRLSQPSLRELEGGGLLRFERLGGTISGWHSLEKAVREWVNTKNIPPPHGHISLEEVRRVAKLKEFPVHLRTFLPPVTFFARYLEPHRFFHHRLPQVGRRVQLNNLKPVHKSGLDAPAGAIYLFFDMS